MAGEFGGYPKITCVCHCTTTESSQLLKTPALPKYLILMKCLRYKLQYFGKGGSPVCPVMAAVPYAEFMGYFFFAHGYMYL